MSNWNEELLAELVPPPVVEALKRKASEDGEFLKDVVKDALYSHAAKLILDEHPEVLEAQRRHTAAAQFPFPDEEWMNADERIAWKRLAEFATLFGRLKRVHSTELDEAVFSIHALQTIMLARAAYLPGDRA